MKAKRMWKKGIGLVLAAILCLFALAGCNSSETASTDSKGDGSKQTESAQSTLDKIKERGKLVVGVKYDLNLFGLKNPETGEVEGFDIDIAKGLAKKILGDENKIELKEVTSKTRIPMLNNGEIDAIIATMTITEDRKKEVDFSDVYFMAGQSLLVKKNSKINGIKDIKKGVTVLTAKGSTSAQNIRAKAPEATVLEFENYAEAFTALKAGQGDALTTDNALLFGMAKQDPNFRVVDETFSEEPYGIAVRKGDKEFVDLINEYLREIKENGEYDKIYEKWIGEKPKQ
ncbi:glutamate ABC transporter substrate-binding protein [Anoxybacillus rupiensis]|jgi:aspartate/glutamate/glutamine transport system substrate-binding protein|uniref:Glutamate ABC transporter substrate-binding protein n=1 Tax=Anoxybacteroides rupiense TaxID=311460 RepID=A0ABD5IUS7_9BACL|nr:MULTISPECIES: glutamate ABC transporter substrate-binding protein [Anoxybacillus]KXG10801.1 ABC transporter glutamine-binding protein GlnH [Anoxybacillus sp. P3H1B]MBB3905903.1 putative glutamine transport system substrate-binding protein [Anoxybacillus rupiensis]MBS2772953.1 transporter substrate-binding domain-containing protein [Anoxybacillus rupiensis]MDE8565021.1 glutamate ABC transporter substrate-binding protein [Anoxybacillus rupiensis]MED5051628.1 glutamate ABC transporter substrat